MAIMFQHELFLVARDTFHHKNRNLEAQTKTLKQKPAILSSNVPKGAR